MQEHDNYITEEMRIQKTGKDEDDRENEKSFKKMES